MATPHKAVRKKTDDETIFEVHFRDSRHSDWPVHDLYIGSPYMNKEEFELAKPTSSPAFVDGNNLIGCTFLEE